MTFPQKSKWVVDHPNIYPHREGFMNEPLPIGIRRAMKTHLGKENGELFKFCPRCLIKIQ